MDLLLLAMIPVELVVPPRTKAARKEGPMERTTEWKMEMEWRMVPQKESELVVGNFVTPPMELRLM
jgi:hypothetical protein